MKLQICALLLSFLFARRKLRRRADGDDTAVKKESSEAVETEGVV